jgi:hypothetical protein
MGTWTAQAEQFADAIREPGFKAAEVTASAWRAGVHAEATRGLVGAALALTAGEAMSSPWAQAEQCPSDSALLEHARANGQDITGAELAIDAMHQPLLQLGSAR